MPNRGHSLWRNDYQNVEVTKDEYQDDIIWKVKVDGFAFGGMYDPNIFVIG